MILLILYFVITTDRITGWSIVNIIALLLQPIHIRFTQIIVLL